MDANAFKHLFIPCNKKLFLIACRLLGNSNDAEDMVQEAYLRLWNKRDELESISNHEAYAVTVLKRICIDFIRSKHETTNNIAETDILNGYYTTDNIETDDELHHVITIMEHLPPQQKLVMRLRRINDYSMEEIEKTTGLSNINIRTLLSRARKKIREQYNHIYN